MQSFEISSKYFFDKICIFCIHSFTAYQVNFFVEDFMDKIKDLMSLLDNMAPLGNDAGPDHPSSGFHSQAAAKKMLWVKRLIDDYVCSFGTSCL